MGGPQDYDSQYAYPNRVDSDMCEAQFGNLAVAAEVESSGESKPKLIVGIEFVSAIEVVAFLTNLSLTSKQGTNFSSAAFAFTTNPEAKEEIITQWPGASKPEEQVRL